MNVRQMVGFALTAVLFTQMSHLVMAAPVLKLDRSTYTPFDMMVVTLTDSSLDTDSESIETVQVTISGSSASEKIILRETTRDSGIFQSEIRLTPDPSRYLGDMQVRRDDGITIAYRADAENVITQTVFIEYNEAVVSFDKTSYQLMDIARVRLTERDANVNPIVPDVVSVKVWSDTDTNGLALMLRETDRSSGIFEEELLFTLTDASSGNRLKVSEGDTINASYVDSTLPAPAPLSADGISTLESKTIVSSGVFGKQIPSTQRAPAAEPTLVNSFGQIISQALTGEQLLIQSEVTNTQNKKQPFAYIVQVKDADGITVSLSWVTSELPPNETLKVAQSWLPSRPGSYSIEIFVWESLTNPTALSPTRAKNVDVLR
ncbi:MAG: hypothetical protein QXU32_08305 [Nitrososphaerales archaeon]